MLLDECSEARAEGFFLSGAIDAIENSGGVELDFVLGLVIPAVINKSAEELRSGWENGCE